MLAVEAVGAATRSRPGSAVDEVDAGHADLGESELARPARAAARAASHGAVRRHDAAVDHPPILETPPRCAGPTRPPARAFAARARRARRRCATPSSSCTAPLGAGKTTFVRHLLRALGVAGPHQEPDLRGGGAVRAAPTRLAISHFDFYRFDDPQEWEDAGFRDIFAGPGLKLAEWPEKAARPAAACPTCASTIDAARRRRAATCAASTPRRAARRCELLGMTPPRA